MEQPVFNSKILLFGEYSILLGYPALSVPVNVFCGNLALSARTKPEIESNREIEKMFYFLSRATEFDFLELERLKSELQQGLFFNSTIPQSYGVGSSGALVASIYARYRYGFSNLLQWRKTMTFGSVSEGSHLHTIQKELALIESFYHGKSSGIDPLSILLDLPLNIEGENLALIPVEQIKFLNDHLFLYNSRKPASTKGLVTDFLNKVNNSDYQLDLQTNIGSAVMGLNASVRNMDVNAFFENLKNLSAFQLKYFKEMIPEDLWDFWESGLKHDTYYMKLCGSGGGGFLLLFKKEKQAEISSLPFNSIQKIIF